MTEVIKKEIEWGGRTLSLETGRLAGQATGSVLVTYGDTSVLCTVVADRKPSDNVDFFPLTVNYVEKAYAAGKIPGGFVKREGRPSERETLISRLIDRPIRPLFHEAFHNETQVICTVLSFDGQNDTDVISIVGACAALTLSGIPFLGPIAAAKVGYQDGKFILNPRLGQESKIDLVIAGSQRGVLMVECGAGEVPEDEMLEALKFGFDSFQPVIAAILELAENAAADPWDVAEPAADDDSLVDKIQVKFLDDVAHAYGLGSKKLRTAALASLYDSIKAHYARDDVDELKLHCAFESVCSSFVRNKILREKSRIDGRSMRDVRKISVDVGVLPRVHGSAIFTRGETQALVVTTLGTAQDEQMVDGLPGEYRERFMLHYNFPPFSVGEIGRLGAPGRREIGHGRLAARALEPVIPTKAEFPYSLRVVSEVLACNGSSSMATVCGTSLSLMDAGVPLKKAVAGVAMGLVVDGERHEILSDIMGEEDHLGDMDFKVAGTVDGITALQMDIKVAGIGFDVMEKALQQAKEGRLLILKEMSKGLQRHRPELNENAPKMTTIMIPKDKIREVIGSGGKVIRDIIEQTGAKIDIDDSGSVTVAAPNNTSLESALKKIKDIALDPVDGIIYRGTVVKVMDFGAFVNFYGSQDGLVHISEMSDLRVEKVTDVVVEGDEVDVMFMGYDNRGRAKLTMKFKRD
ncbi:MAG: polyribonucleotide nucleotidyltransferase [Holosporaceae bacterium]|jgi:polyribonucleotide nucleotidyltransferase|nr:polyribonucleotide nucleotidyltransferase [Holosporaceae bacterium]